MKLKELRNELGLTQQQAADGIGIQREIYVRYKNGSGKPPLEKLIAIAEFFHVSIDYLVERTKFATYTSTSSMWTAFLVN